MVAVQPSYASGIDRIPPANLSAEMAVLGAILVDAAMFDVVAQILEPDDFYASLHESIYLALQALYDARKPLDKIALAEELRVRGMLDKVGGLGYLNSLVDTVPTAASAGYHARVVREKAELRALIHVGTRVTEIGFTGEDDVKSAIEEARTAVELATSRKRDEHSIETIARTGLAVWDQLFERRTSRLVRLPWERLQKITGGFSPKQLSAWLAAPGAGKTGILFDVCAHAAHRQPELGMVVLVSLELEKDEMTKRAIAHFSAVPRDRLEPGEFDKNDEIKIYNALTVLNALRLVILDGAFSISQLRAVLRRIKRDEGAISLVAVDAPAYLRDVARGKETTKHERFEDALKELRGLAMELDAHVTLAHHLNREGFKDPKKPPTMMQSRDGGNLEGTADLVIIPWLPNVGYETTPVVGQVRDLDGGAGEAHDRARLEALGRWIIAKNRKGKGGGRWLDDLSFVGSRYTWVEGENGRPWWWSAPEITAQLAAERQVPLFETDGAGATSGSFVDADNALFSAST